METTGGCLTPNRHDATGSVRPDITVADADLEGVDVAVVQGQPALDRAQAAVDRIGNLIIPHTVRPEDRVETDDTVVAASNVVAHCRST